MGVATSPAGRRWSDPAQPIPPRRKQSPRVIILYTSISHKFSKISLTHCDKSDTWRVLLKNTRTKCSIYINRRRVWILHWRQPGLSCFPPNAATRKPLWGVAYAGSPALSFYYRLLFRWWLIQLLQQKKKRFETTASSMSTYVGEKGILYELISTGQKTTTNIAADASNRWVTHTHDFDVFFGERRRSQLLAAPCCNNNMDHASSSIYNTTSSWSCYRCVLCNNMMRSRGSTKCLQLAAAAPHPAFAPMPCCFLSRRELFPPKQDVNRPACLP